MNIALSPWLHRICWRLPSYRYRFQWNQLNVCNVMRSLLLVILTLDVLIPAGVFFLVNGLVQLIFVMTTFHLWGSPLVAVDIIGAMSYAGKGFDWHSWIHWASFLNLAVSGVFAVIGCVVFWAIAVALPAAVTIYYTWTGLKALLGSDKTEKAFMQVIGPVELAAHWVAGKHSRFCRHIAAVEHKSPYQKHKDRVAEIEQETKEYRWSVAYLPMALLEQNIDKTRAILMKHVRA